MFPEPDSHTEEIQQSIEAIFQSRGLQNNLGPIDYSLVRIPLVLVIIQFTLL